MRVKAYRLTILSLVCALIAGCSSGAIDENVDTSAAYQAAANGDYGTVALALGNGLDINKPDSSGKTLLHYAVEANQDQMVEDLIEKQRGIDVNAKDAQGRTPLSYAVEAGNQRIIQILSLNGAKE